MELQRAKDMYDRILAAFQAKSIEESIEKFDSFISANESLRSYINHLLMQLAEERGSKRSLKMELKGYHEESRQQTEVETEMVEREKVEGETQEVMSKRLLVFDAVSALKSTLSRIDRIDEDRLFGPHLSEITSTSDFDLSLGFLLLIERKLWQCQSAYQQRTQKRSPTKSTRGRPKVLTALFSSYDAPRKSLFQAIDLKFTATSVNNIRSRLYSSHFVEDPEPTSALLTGKSKGKISTFLSDVAKVHFEVSSNLKAQKMMEIRRSPELEKEKDDEAEVAFLASEVKRMKKDSNLNQLKPGMHKHTLSLQEYKNGDMRKLQKHRSELDLALGIPQISKHIQELNHMAMVYQKTQSGSDAGLKELYQEHCRKK